MPWRFCCAPILILAVTADPTSPVLRIGAAHSGLGGGVGLSFERPRLRSAVSAAETDRRVVLVGEDGVGTGMDVDGGAPGAPDTPLGVILATSNSQSHDPIGSPAAPCDMSRSGGDPDESGAPAPARHWRA